MLSRRRLLLSSAVTTGALTLAGCGWFDPTVQGRGSQGSATPEPNPGADQLRAVSWLDEMTRALAAVTTAVGANGTQRAWALSCTAALGFQELVLRRPDPLSGALPEPIEPPPTTATPPVPIATALTRLTSVAQARSSDLLAVATAAAAGAPALLWGSLALFARGCATVATNTAMHPVVDQKVLPHRIDPVPLGEAQGVLVAHLYRAEQAVPGLVGALPSGDLRTTLRERLTALARLRVDVQTDMRESGATPPPPEPGYELPERPTADNVGPVMGAIETDVSNALAGVFSASDDRAAAFETWAGQSANVTRWTGLSRFPGWV